MTGEIDNVIASGLCVGCGACSALNPERFSVNFNSSGQYIASTNGVADPAGDLVCPFSNSAKNEEDIAALHFADSSHVSNHLGRYESVFVGHSNDEFRSKGSSGGVTNWLLHELLTQRLVDAVIVVGQGADNLYEYQIVNDANQLGHYSKSKYYPVTLGKILSEAGSEPGKKFALVGVPCFVKAVRNLASVSETHSSQFKYFIALVCGHLKSSGFSEMIAWDCGIAPDRLSSIDYRVKIPNVAANRYSVAVTSVQGKTITKPVFDTFGTDWGLGFFKYPACDYCDDVAGECADVTLGDAWLHPEIKDWEGNNIIITRNKELDSLIRMAGQSAQISLREVSENDFVKSQSSNYRHRRDGLPSRIARMRSHGGWAPKKRTHLSSPVAKSKEQAMLYRERLRDQSYISFRKAKASKDFQVFKRLVLPTMIKYYFLNNMLMKFFVKEFVKLLNRFNANSS